MNVLLWVVFPYLAMAVLIGGLIWRHRYDKFGWTTRSSQLYESAVLRWGSPMFHFGVLMVLVGHIGGLVIPKSWTEAVGITEHTYHLMAVFVGTVAGFCTLIGMAILIARRRLTGPVFAATTKNDKTMYVVLASVIVLGLWATLLPHPPVHPLPQPRPQARAATHSARRGRPAEPAPQRGRQDEGHPAWLTLPAWPPCWRRPRRRGRGRPQPFGTGCG